MSSSKPHILYVDDEENNLISFKSNFRRNYEVYTAISATEGKKLLETQPIHIIITDQRMPHTTGVEFLESIIENHPDPVRIMLTGYADIEAVIASINKGQLFKYATKPLNIEEITKIIEEAYSVYQFKVQNKKLLEKYKILFENSGNSAFVLNAKGKLMEFNNATMSLFGFSRNKMINSDADEFFFDEINERKFFSELKNKKRIRNFEIQLRNKQRDKISCLISLTIIRDKNKNIVGYQGNIVDVSEQKKATNSLLKKIIESQEKERDSFSKNLHENIAQQLAGINYYIQTLKDTNDFAEKNSETKINEISNSLTSVLNDIRELSYEIMPRTLAELGLVESLHGLCTKLSRSSSLTINFICRDTPKKLDTAFEINIFRVAHEFLKGLMIQGKVMKLSVELQYLYENITLIITSNNKNTDDSLILKPSDFDILKSKIESYNATLILGTKSDSRVNIRILFPLSK